MGGLRYPPKEAETKRLPCCAHACMSCAAVGEAGREKMETENLVSIFKSERTFGYSSVCIEISISMIIVDIGYGIAYNTIHESARNCNRHERIGCRAQIE